MKRKDDEEHEKENGERWLLTYADLITLLLALFIILYAMSSVDLDKFKSLSKYLKYAFNNNDAVNEEISLPDSLGDIIINDSSSGSGSDNSGGDEESSNAIDEVYKFLVNYINENNLKDMIDISKTQNELKITLKYTILFKPDTSNMLPASQPILQKINTSLIGIYDKVDHITISGHTADYYNEGNKSTDFDWNLSVDRALAVLHFFKNNGLPEYKLSIEGYSHFNPTVPNSDRTNIGQNRRVEIIVHKESQNKGNQ